MPGQYKLYYLNLKGRAEISRLILAAADVPYEDIRMNMPEFKQKFKQGNFVREKVKFNSTVYLSLLVLVWLSTTGL